MSFLAPFMLVIGGVAAAAVVALHLLTTRRPPRAVLPTARFVPVSEARAVARSARPTDLVLLACRVLAALLLGAAFAQPVLDARGPAVRSVVMLDRSAGVADATAAARLAIERLTVGGALVVFDTVAREVGSDTAERAAVGISRTPARTPVQGTAQPPRAAHGILSAALVAGIRAGRRVARGADSVRLVLVSTLAREEFDSATDALRAEWPGGIELVPVAAVADTARGKTVRLVTSLADDPLAPALERLDVSRGAQEVRIVRTAPSIADSAWVREEGRVLVVWPVPSGVVPVADGVTAFGLHSATIVAPLVRLPIEPPAGASPRGPAIAWSRVIARWRDGAVAVAESPLGGGCVRAVGVGIPLAGDLTLRTPFDRFLATIVEPCGGARGRAVSDSVAQRFAGDAQAASASRLVAGAGEDSAAAALLLALALAALTAEWMLRRRRIA